MDVTPMVGAAAFYGGLIEDETARSRVTSLIEYARQKSNPIYALKAISFARKIIRSEREMKELREQYELAKKIKDALKRLEKMKNILSKMAMSAFDPEESHKYKKDHETVKSEYDTLKKIKDSLTCH